MAAGVTPRWRALDEWKAQRLHSEISQERADPRHRSTAGSVDQLGRIDAPPFGTTGNESRKLSGRVCLRRRLSGGRTLLDRRHELAAPENALIARPLFPATAETLHCGPPTQAAPQCSTLKVGAPALRHAGHDKGSISPLGNSTTRPELAQHFADRLPRPIRAADQGAVSTPEVAVELCHGFDEPCDSYLRASSD